jgi:hypothetical protein
MTLCSTALLISPPLTGPLTLSNYERFQFKGIQWVRRALEKQGISLAMPTR